MKIREFYLPWSDLSMFNRSSTVRVTGDEFADSVLSVSMREATFGIRVKFLDISIEAVRVPITKLTKETLITKSIKTRTETITFFFVLKVKCFIIYCFKHPAIAFA